MTYPTTYDKDAREVLRTPDGGYIVAGSTNNSDPSDADIYVLRTDAQGNFLWGKTYGGSKPEYAFSMIETSDGNYFILGYSMSFGGGDFDIYLIKIDPSGGLIWQKTYGGSGNEHGREIIKTNDGNYVMVGTTNTGFSDDQVFVTKIDLAGSIIWSKYYGGNMHEGGNTVKETPDGGLIVGGQTFSFGQNNGSAYLIKTTSMGDSTWTKYYNTGAIISEINSLVSNSDGSYAFVVRDSAATTDVDIRVMKTDGTGGIQWNKRYGGNQKDTPKRICITNDGGYVIASTSRSFGWINPDMWILKLNTTGDTTWTKHFGGTNHEHGNDIKQTPDGGYIAVGHSKSYGADGQRIMLVKINGSGDIGLRTYETDITSNLFPNPTKGGNINIQVGKTISTQITISNYLGKIVYNQALAFEANETKTLDLGDKSPGIYLVTIKAGESSVSKRVVVE